MNSPRPLLFQERRAERFEQFTIDRIASRLVFGMPLHAERKARGLGDPDRLDRAVIRHAFDDDALAGFENALAVQRIDANAFGAEELGEYAAWRQPHVMTFGEHNLDIRMEFAIRQPRRAMIDAAGQVADFG